MKLLRGCSVMEPGFPVEPFEKSFTTHLCFFQFNTWNRWFILARTEYMTFLEKGRGHSTVAKLSDILGVCLCWGFYTDSQATLMQVPETPSFVTRGSSVCYQFGAM